MSSNDSDSNSRNSKASHPSRATQVKTDITKLFLEEHFKTFLKESRESKQRRENFKEIISSGEFDQDEKQQLEQEFNKEQDKKKRVKRRVFRIEQFEKIKLIGRGAFGDVYVVRDKEDNQIYAMKILYKSELLSKGQILNTLSERDCLTQSDNPWSVHFKIQDTYIL